MGTKDIHIEISGKDESAMKPFEEIDSDKESNYGEEKKGVKVAQTMTQVNRDSSCASSKSLILRPSQLASCEGLTVDFTSCLPHCILHDSIKHSPSIIQFRSVSQ